MGKKASHETCSDPLLRMVIDPSPGRGHRWSKERTARFVRAYREGLPVSEMAWRFGMTYNAARNQIAALRRRGVSIPRRKHRQRGTVAQCPFESGGRRCDLAAGHLSHGVTPHRDVTGQPMTMDRPDDR